MEKHAKIFNIKLSVLNLSESIDWYRKVFKPLGFNEGWYFKNDPYDNGDTFAFGNDYFIIEMQEVPKNLQLNSFNPKRVGLSRIEIYSETKEQVDNFFEHLKTLNVDILKEPQYMYKEKPDHVNYEKGEKWYALHFCDPSGIIWVFLYTDWRL